MAKALIFDVFGTVVDWRTGISRQVEAYCADRMLFVDGLEFADSWRGLYQPAMEEIRSGKRPYVPLDVLHLENLNQVLAQWEMEEDLPPSDRPELARAWEKLPPWDDVVDGLSRMKNRYAIAPCSNGSIALMTRLARYAGLPWDCILGAEIAQAYKPDPAVYTQSAAALGLEPSEVMMVAAHNSDLEAAKVAGLKTAFVFRPTEHGPGQTSDLTPTGDWDMVAADFNRLADMLES